MTLSYLSESEHLARGVLEDDSDLSQVGGALPEQSSLRAAGWNKERQLSSKLLSPVLHLVGLKSHREESDHDLRESRSGAEAVSSGYKSCWDNRTLEGVHCRLMRTF